MLKKELVKDWVIKNLLKGRQFNDISVKIHHVTDVNSAAIQINPLRENGDSNGCVEYIPNSMCDLRIFIKQELYDNIEKTAHRQDNGTVVETSMCYRLWYVETLVHECTHYFELINLYKILCNGICYDNEDIRLVRQFSEYSAKKAGYKYYFMALNHFNVFDQGYVNSDLDGCASFYDKLRNKRNGMSVSTFLYHQIRLLAVISAWKEYFNDDKAEKMLLPFFADISIKEDILSYLNINLEEINKAEVVELIDDFLKLLNNSTMFK